MIGGIATNPASGLGLGRAGPASRHGAARGPAREGQAIATTVSRLAAEEAPLDTDRVAALRVAIRAGTYRWDADTIASRMIAADLGDTQS